MATRKDVARRAGVSQATVSNALNGSKFVSADLLARVREAAEALGYQPDFYAKQLKSRSFMQIGVLVDELNSPFFWNVLEGINEVAIAEQYGIHFIHCVGDIEEHVERFIYTKMDGVFSFLNLKDDIHVLNSLAAAGIAVVVGGYAHPVFSSIRADERAGMVEALEHLRSLGHANVAFVSDFDPDWDDVGDRFEDAHRDVFGRSVDPRLVIHVPLEPRDDLAAGASGIAALLDGGVSVDAVLFRSDLAALGALGVLQSRGLRVPEHISLVGHDDVMVAPHTHPALTTIHIPTQEMGRRAMRLMIEHIRSGTRGAIEVQPVLVVRESTGPVPRLG